MLGHTSSRGSSAQQHTQQPQPKHIQQPQPQQHFVGASTPALPIEHQRPPIDRFRRRLSSGAPEATNKKMPSAGKNGGGLGTAKSHLHQVKMLLLSAKDPVVSLQRLTASSCEFFMNPLPRFRTATSTNTRTRAVSFHLLPLHSINLCSIFVLLYTFVPISRQTIPNSTTFTFTLFTLFNACCMSFIFTPLIHATNLCLMIPLT